MKKLSFKVQIWLGMGIFILCLVLAAVTNTPLFRNIGWMLYGLLFIVNPVPPENVHGEEKTVKLIVRIAGIIAVAWGLLTRFSV